MLTSVFIIVISGLLFGYWLRYSVIMLLRNAQERSQGAVAEDDRFSFSAVLERLKTESDLDPLERTLERDYLVVTYFIEHAADLEVASVENKLLVLDYKLMRIWSRVTRTMAPEQSRRALAEMATVLHVLVSQMGDQDNLQLEA
ncbi:MAG: hypothetical protein ABI759_02425 [Candidatus Solibacter sp.]